MISTTDINPSPLSRRRLNFNQGIMQRQTIFRTTGGKRPVDKNLISILLSALDATQQTVTLVTATFPCTIVGLRWNMSHIQSASTGICDFAWAIVILRDGLTQPTLSTTSGSTFYNPEQDVMAFGVSTIDNNVQSNQWEGSTKTMRKMMGGDKLVFIGLGVATNTSRVSGVVQFFCKT